MVISERRKQGTAVRVSAAAHHAHARPVERAAGDEMDLLEPMRDEHRR